MGTRDVCADNGGRLESRRTTENEVGKTCFKNLGALILHRARAIDVGKGLNEGTAMRKHVMQSVLG